MKDLKLIGLGEDGEHLNLADESGQEHRLMIDDALLAAVRRDKQRLERIHVDRDHQLRPRDIQARIRAGADAQSLADESGMSVESIRLYETAILAEREYIALKARSTQVTYSTDAPTLEDVVNKRLAERNIDASNIEWDSSRVPPEPWKITVTFTQTDTPIDAQWSFDLNAGTLTPLNEEAVWLSQEDSPQSVVIGKVHLSGVFDVDAPASRIDPAVSDIRSHPAFHGTPSEVDEKVERMTENMLATLEERRGRRSPVSADDEALFEEDEVAPTPVESVQPTKKAKDADVLVLPDPPPVPNEPVTGKVDRVKETSGAKKDKRSSRSKRPAMPSWDDIVFGAKED